MKLSEFGLLADENVQREVVAHLRGRGCDVLEVRESGLSKSDDTDLLRFASSQNRVVLTHDSDFGSLAIVRGEPLVGLVFLRPGHIDPHFTIDTLDVLLDRNLDLVPPFIVVASRSGDRVTIRLRNLRGR